MAIQFARLQYVKRSAGQSVCHKAAYNGRLSIHDERLEKTFRYDDKTDSAYHAILLPEGANEKYADPATLWNAIEAVEGRWDSQVGKEMVLALPDDASITLQDRIALTRGFVQKYFVSNGLVCQVDIHGSDGVDAGENWHAHVLMPTRPCQGDGFGKKARHLDVDVRGGRVMGTDKQWGRLWAQYQNDYFKENQIDVKVDPIALVPDVHLGPVRMRGDKAPSVMERSMLLHEENRRYAQQEDLVLRHLTRQQSTFTKEDVNHFIDKHIDLAAQDDFKQRFYESDLLILVGQDRYTARAVLDEERKLLRMGDRLARRTADAPFSMAKEMCLRAKAHCHPRAGEELFTLCNKDFSRFDGKAMGPRLREDDKDLTKAQQQAVDRVIEGPNLTVVEGAAGSGKSHVMGALKDIYQQAGYTARGFATQAHMVTQMQQDGFEYAASVRSFLFKQYYEREGRSTAPDPSVWITPGKEVWFVDAATTVQNPDMTELLDLAWVSNVKVVLCGDAQQTPGQGRGGAFLALKERYGTALLDDHSRQKDDTQRKIVDAIVQGAPDKALDHMAALGTWHHHDKEPAAIKDLLSCWYVRYQVAPENSFMILEHRSQYIRVFNEKIHHVLKSRGDVDMHEISIETATHGLMQFSAGDALVFMQKDDELGVATGMRGILLHASEDCFTVRVNDQRYVVFNPQVYNNFQHGYAGLIHSAQGQTFDHVFALHSKHIDAQAFYVACSRHTLSCDYFSSGDKDAVKAAMTQNNILDPGSAPVGLVRETSYLDDCVAMICDVFYKDHDYYRSYDYTRAPSYVQNDLQKELVLG